MFQQIKRKSHTRGNIVARNYWLDLFTVKTWEEFLKAGGEVSGHREGKWNTVRQIKPGDYLLAYVTGISRFIGILEVVSEPYRDDVRIWEDDLYPCRIKVKIIISLTFEAAVPILALKDQLLIFQNLKSPNAWTIYFRRSPMRYSLSDGEIIAKAITEAKNNPVSRPINKRKLSPRPKTVKTEIGHVAVPEQEEIKPTIKEATIHDEIQWILVKLGNDMGLDVWVARNDRNKEIGSHHFTDLQHLVEKLPVQFDEATNRIIELIDVLWLKGNAITAAFEIESTTSIYSGLLRMSDLIAMQPNLNIPLYIVVPEERRNKVITEVNRPTFSRLSPPLSQLCRLITFPLLRDQVQQLKPHIVANLKPNFLKDLSEPCNN
jgi:predicted RNA-binding protein